MNINNAGTLNDSDEAGDEHLINTTCDEVWEQLLAELLVSNAIGRYALKRRKRLQKWIAAGCTFLCLLTAGGIYYWHGNKMPMEGTARIIPAQQPATRVTKKNITAKAMQDTLPADISLPKKYTAVATAPAQKTTVKVLATSPPSDSVVQGDQSDTQQSIPHWKLVKHPSQHDTIAPSRDWPMEVDHNDLLDVLQRKTDKLYQQKKSAQKDSTSIKKQTRKSKEKIISPLF